MNRKRSQWVYRIAGLLIVLFAMNTVVADGPEIADEPEFGDAWTDPRNPIRVLFRGERLDLWSLQPIRRPAPPIVSDGMESPTDAFLETAWREAGYEPAPQMDRSAWIQRATLDLTGLRANQEEVDAFVQDASPDAYERVVDRLLASPAYGEHSARLWLDVVRYSDSNGFDWDEFRKNAWRYRDWVVRACNADLPFDRFLTMQLAGDELLSGPPRNADEQDCLIATGYLRLGPYDNAAKLFNEQDRARVEVLTDLTETTASAMLGLTMSCCRCHDHKTDPLSQADHYRLRAFFAATRFADDLSIDTLDVQQARESHNRRIQAEIDERNKAIESLREQEKKRKQVDAPKLSEESTTEELAQAKPPSDAELMSSLSAEDRETWERLARSIASLTRQLQHPETGLIMTDDSVAIDPIHVLFQGDHRAARELVEPGFPSVLFPNPPRIETVHEGKSTGRRLALARWICSPENPWTARVAVNRVWQMCFGQGLVVTPNDFGMTGSPPTQPELLDYLACQWTERGWSTKDLLRQIVTSNAYRRRAISGGRGQESDATRWASARVNLKRLSAEQFRDCILQVSGLLQHRAGGPPIWPTLSEDILKSNPAFLDDNETKTKGWYPSPDAEQSVRSIYLVQKRNLRLPWMETFDQPENTLSCPKRETSIVAPQALSLMNGELASQAASSLARSLVGEDKMFVTALFETVFSRRPTPEESDRCREFLERQSRASLVLVLINSNEFAFIP